MAKAIIRKTVKIRGKVYQQGGVYTNPFPPGFDIEIGHKTGTIDVEGALSVENVPDMIGMDTGHSEIVITTGPDLVLHDNPLSVIDGESEKDRKNRLRKNILLVWGDEIDGRKSLAEIESIIRDKMSGRISFE